MCFEGDNWELIPCLLPGYDLGNKSLNYRDIHTIRVYVDTFQTSTICQIIDYKTLSGMLDVNYKRIIKSKILSSGSVVDIKKWLKRWGVVNILEL